MAVDTNLSDEERRKAVDEMIAFFSSERDEEIGVIAAESVLDEVLGMVGDTIYNKGVSDATRVMRQRFEEMLIDVETLKRV